MFINKRLKAMQALRDILEECLYYDVSFNGGMVPNDGMVPYCNNEVFMNACKCALEDIDYIIKESGQYYRIIGNGWDYRPALIMEELIPPDRGTVQLESYKPVDPEWYDKYMHVDAALYDKYIAAGKDWYNRLTSAYFAACAAAVSIE